LHEGFCGIERQIKRFGGRIAPVLCGLARDDLNVVDGFLRQPVGFRDKVFGACFTAIIGHRRKANSTKAPCQFRELLRGMVEREGRVVGC